MRMLTFSTRTAKEVLRDPLTALFGLGFPLALLGLLTAIRKNVPVPLFALEKLAPGVAVFGQAFLTLFAAMLVARDRESSFLRRLYTTPLTAWDYILGYTLPLVPMGLAQSALCYLAAVCLGLPATGGVGLAILSGLPGLLFFIGLGLLCGTVLSDKQVGGPWLSGAWFDVELVGGWFRTLARSLPFLHAVELQRAALGGGAVRGHLAGCWATWRRRLPWPRRCSPPKCGKTENAGRRSARFFNLLTILPAGWFIVSSEYFAGGTFCATIRTKTPSVRSRRNTISSARSRDCTATRSTGPLPGRAGRSMATTPPATTPPGKAGTVTGASWDCGPFWRCAWYACWWPARWAREGCI